MIVIGFRLEQRTFRKYEFSSILSNTVTLDTNACISESMLTSVINLNSFNENWIKWPFILLKLKIRGEVKGLIAKVELITDKMNSKEFIHSFTAQPNPRLPSSFFFFHSSSSSSKVWVDSRSFWRGLHLLHLLHQVTWFSLELELGRKLKFSFLWTTSEYLDLI